MSSTVTASDGTMIPLDSVEQDFAYSGSLLTTITVVYQGKTFVQTFTYSGSNVATISGWIKQ